MQGKTSKVLLAIIFVGLLATPLAIRQWRMYTAGAAQKAADPLSRYGFRLVESAGPAGVTFIHSAPSLDPRLAHIMPQVASMGAGVAVADFDRDGWQDFYVTNSGEGSRNALFRNNGDGTFRDVAAEAGVAELNAPGSGVSMGAVWGDFDNDGLEDLFVYKWGRPELFRNVDGARFERVTEKAGFPAWVNANTAIWLDYDRDGLLDIFLGGYYPEDVNLWQLRDTKMMPESFEYAKNGGRKYLLRNLGGGAFADVTADAKIDSRRWALAAVSSDFDGNGYPDVFVANDYGVSELFLNDGTRFRDAGAETGVGFAPKSGMNASVGDVLNQGAFAIYVSNISEDGILIQGNNLWVPTGGTALKYENLAREMGVELGGWSFGAQFGDLNNDGTLDLYLTNGYVSDDREGSYWYDFSKVAGGNAAIISDAANWPPMEGRSLAGYQSKRVWVNDGAGRFADVAQAVGVTDTFDGRAVALADLGNAGALDVLVANQRGPLLLYRNSVRPEHAWIAFELEGTKSNRSAIGAQVRLLSGGSQQLQEVLGGSGFCAQNQRRLHFGLGRDGRPERAEIRWPSGRVQTIEAPEPGRIHKIKEPDA